MLPANRVLLVPLHIPVSSLPDPDLHRALPTGLLPLGIHPQVHQVHFEDGGLKVCNRGEGVSWEAARGSS